MVNAAQAAMTTDQGVVFPSGADGRRSTVATNRAVWAAAVRGPDPELAAAIDGTDTWRDDYPAHVRAVTERGARSPETARGIAQDGLKSARSRLVFRRDGQDHRLDEAPRLTPYDALSTETVAGIEAPVT